MASIVLSCASVVYGVCIGVSKLLETRTALLEDDFQQDQALDFSGGKGVSFARMDLTELATQEALLWFLSEDTPL